MDSREISLGRKQRTEEIPELPGMIGEEDERASIHSWRVRRLRNLEKIMEDKGVLKQESLVNSEADVLGNENNAPVLEPELGVALQIGRRR